MSFSFRTALYAFAALITLYAPQAMAGVTITPNTLVIEGNQRYADITLVNGGTETNTYEMGWKFFRQTEGTGRYQKVDGSNTPFDLTQNMVFTPKRITLVPGKAQKVRLALRLKGELPPLGDYRGHFELREATEADPSSVDGKPKVGVHIRVGFTIPVIYRVGQSDATATIGKVSTQIGKNGKIEAVIPVTKSQSAYGILGDLAVFHNDEQVGGVANANIFPEITSRTFTVPLTAKDLSSGTLRIVYRDRDETKNMTYAQKSIPIGR